ncbi:E3 ubiquitin-protein ligase WAVH1-like protein [Drosera capensis]
MVTGWRRAFCTSVHKDHEHNIAHEDKSDAPRPTKAGGDESCDADGGSCHRSPRFGFRFFSSSSTGSNPSTPRVSTPAASTPVTAPATPASGSPARETPRLQCKTGRKRMFFQRSAASTPSSPRSPSPFALLKKTLRLSKTRCGECSQSIKTGQGTAIFTAECSHVFHFPCLAATIAKHGGLACPICGSKWKEVPLLTVHHKQKPKPEPHSTNDNKSDNNNNGKKFSFKDSASFELKLYNDDEPLTSNMSGGGSRFNPIPESDENEDADADDETLGYRSGLISPKNESKSHRDIEVKILPDAVVVSVGRSHETYAAILRIKAPPAPSLTRRAPADLVALLDLGGAISSPKLQTMKRAMRSVVSSLSSLDRLSIVAFSSSSKRLLPLRRMSPAGRRSARRIIDSLIGNQGSSSVVNDAARKAAKVFEDRREKNPASAIFLFSDNDNNSNQSSPSSPLVSSSRYSTSDFPLHLISVAALSASSAAEEAFVNSVSNLLTVVALDLRLQIRFRAGSTPAQVVSIYSLTGRAGPMCLGSGRLGDMYADEEREMMLELRVPSGLVSARHVIHVRSFFKGPLGEEIVRGEERAVVVPRVQGIRSSDPVIRRLRTLFMATRERDVVVGPVGRRVEVVGEREREEVMTPTSAWRAAERLAKVAVMRKSLTRVSDLHGFENARF